MPNIEIHGLSYTFHSLEIMGLRQQIWEALEGSSYIDQVVVGQVADVVHSQKSSTEKFLRIWATSQSEVDDIVKRLDPLDIDIELPPLLANFIEKWSVRLKKQGEPKPKTPDHRDWSPAMDL